MNNINPMDQIVKFIESVESHEELNAIGKKVGDFFTENFNHVAQMAESNFRELGAKCEEELKINIDEILDQASENGGHLGSMQRTALEVMRNVLAYQFLNTENRVLVKKIDAFLSQQSFFNAYFPPELLPNLFALKGNKYHLKIFSSSFPIAALACVSKTWNYHIYLLKTNWEVEHINLQSQMYRPALARCCNAEEAVNLIIEQKLQLANLKNFTITDEQLEKLFQKNPHIQHLFISSPFVTKLPETCSHLQTLDISHCSNIVDLPKSMPVLTFLDCNYCKKLTKLPENMAELIDLNCDSTKQLTALPAGMQSLRRLDCCLSNVSLLPDDLPSLEKFLCAGCIYLDTSNCLNQPNKDTCVIS